MKKILSNLKIRQKLILAFILVAAFPILIIGYYAKKSASQSLMDLSAQKMQQTVSKISFTIENTIETGIKEVNFLGNVPPIQGIINGLDNPIQAEGKSEVEVWRGRLNTIFYSLAKSKNSYHDILYVDELGNVLAHVKSTNGSYEKSSTQSLESIASEEEFIATMNLVKGRTYIGVLKTIYENNKSKKMLSLAIPIFNENIPGQRRGVVVLRLLTDNIMNVLSSFEDDNNRFFLLTEAGKLTYGDEKELKKEDLATFNSNSDFVVSKDKKYAYAYTSAIVNKTTKDKWKVIYMMPTHFITARVDDFVLLLAIVMVILFVACIVFGYFFSESLVRPLKKLQDSVLTFAKGNLPKTIAKKNNDEIGEMVDACNSLAENLNNVKSFAVEVGKGSFNTDISVFNNEGELGTALAEMRESLKNVAEEDEKRAWINEGLAKFVDILRSSDNIAKLSSVIISEIVKYLDCNQGSIFIINEESHEHVVMELKACYAWSREKYMEKTIEMGESLIGQAWQEKDKIFLTEIPESYITITSGLGDASPACILIQPLIINEEVFGIIEIASFQKLEKHKMEFVDKLSESIASAISSVKVNERTKKLLEESKKMTEELQAQEEELRQNAEEMQATQEEMNRKIKELELEAKDKTY